MRALGHVSQIFAGRWEIPLALGAVVATSLTLYQLRPTDKGVDFDAVMADIKTLEEAQAFLEATDAAATLLELNPPLPREQRAALHEFLARSVYNREKARNSPNRENAELILFHVRESARLGLAPPTSAILHSAQAYEWLGEVAPAVEAYREVLDGDPTSDEARASHKALVKLLENRPNEAAKRKESLNALLDDDGISPTYLWWALEYAMRDALDRGDTVKAREDLTKYGERLKRSDLKGYYDFLWAWIHFSEGRTAEAAPLVDWVDDWLVDAGRSRIDMGESGYLPALNRWLLGEIHLAEDRPQEALAAFEEAVRTPNAWPIYVAAAVGQGEALLRLNRDAAALAMYREAVEHIGVRLESSSGGDAGPTEFAPDYRIGMAGVSRLRESLVALAEKRRAQQRFHETTGYLTLALQLTERDAREQRRLIVESLAKANVLTAELEEAAGGDAALARSYRRSAAELFETAASLTTFDESRTASMLWLAADQYDRGGRIRDAQRTLRRFVEGRSFDPRYPEALLKLGEAYEADRALTEAIVWYERVAAEYPRLREAARARVLAAGCYSALGQSDRAEAILTRLVDEGTIAPESPAFRAALRALCDLLYRQWRYPEAISRLEDMLALYPEDPARFRSRFMLGDSYRKSAIHHRDNPPQDAEPDQVALLVRARLWRAADLFKELLAEIEGAAALDEDMRLYQRLALFYRGDSLFDLNEPETLRDARTVYQSAAARYAREPAALTAQVQLSNIFLRQGKVAEAARAIEYARWLLDSIPDEAFAATAGEIDRTYWQDYLAKVSASHLFGDVFSSRP